MLLANRLEVLAFYLACSDTTCGRSRARARGGQAASLWPHEVEVWAPHSGLAGEGGGGVTVFSVVLAAVEQSLSKVFRLAKAAVFLFLRLGRPGICQVFVCLFFLSASWYFQVARFFRSKSGIILGKKKTQRTRH